MRYLLSQAAEEDLVQSLAIGIETFGTTETEAYFASLRRVFELLSTFPRMARERTEFQPAVRVHHHGRHYIAYLVEPDHVLIVRVVRDEADLDRLFGGIG